MVSTTTKRDGFVGETLPPAVAAPLPVAVIGCGSAPAIRELAALRDAFRFIHVECKEPGPALNEATAVLLIDTEREADQPSDLPTSLRSALESLRRRGQCAVVLTDAPTGYIGFDHALCMPCSVSTDLLRGALLATAKARTCLLEAYRNLSMMRKLGENLHRHFDEMDRELRLASRLQQEFLPPDHVRFGPLQFTTLFRPCSWVSGDIFDIFRLDEDHVGFYLADAVGHGVAAGLLTIYIKNAIKTKRIFRNDYEIVPPGEVMQVLNAEMVSQCLPDSQFVTAWYGIVNLETLELTYANAGHPPPLLIDESGSFRELHGDGCLLGIAASETYGNRRLTLSPGQRLLVYSDGIEEALVEYRPPFAGPPQLKHGTRQLLRDPADEFLVRLCDRLDNMPGSLMHADDCSFVMVDVTEKPHEAA